MILAPFPLGDIEGFTPNSITDTALATADPADRLSTIVSNVVAVFTIFAGLAFLIYFILAALNWMQGGADPAKLEKAKNQLSTAIVGLLIMIVLLSLASIISSLLGLNILDPKDIIPLILPK